GEVTAGEAAAATLTYQNVGSGVLKVYRVDAGCDCLATAYTETLRPGERGAIEVRFLPPVLSGGPVEKRLAVLSNDPDQPSVTVQITARVRPLFRVTPAAPLTVRYTGSQPIRQVFTIENADWGLPPLGGRGKSA